MKLIIITTIILLLSGCASNITTRYNSYLQLELIELLDDNYAISDTLETVKENNAIFRSVLRDFVTVSDESISSAILKRHGIVYELPDGRLIGK